MCHENEKVLCRGQSSRHHFMHNLLKTYPDYFTVFNVKRRFHDVNITDIKKKKKKECLVHVKENLKLL